MATYRVGRHWGVTIVREGVEPIEMGKRADDELVAVVTNGDRDLAERICELLNDGERATQTDQQERADVRRRIAEQVEHRPSSLGDGLGYGPCVGCGELWPCGQSRRECPL